MKRAIITVGVSQTRLFGPYLERFHRTFKEFGGADYLKIWHRDWPPGSPTHHQCNYAFKVHAVTEAIERGCTSVLYFDCCCWAFRSVEPLWERLARDGHVLVEDANKLGNWSSDHALAYFGVTRDEAMSIPLMCGTCWGLDLTNPRSVKFLERLHSLAVPEHFNGTHVSRLPGLPAHPRPDTDGYRMSNDGRCWGHRSDEVYMGFLARELGMETHAGVEFIGGCGNDNPRACVKSGYDIVQPPQPRSHASPPRHANGYPDFGNKFDE